ncbi:MAG: hypothetical protein ACRCS8_06405 [Brevinema sp.]
MEKSSNTTTSNTNTNGNNQRFNRRRRNKNQDKQNKTAEKPEQKTSPTPAHTQTNTHNNHKSHGHHGYQKQHHNNNNHHHNKHHKQDIPKWDYDQLFKATEYKETKAELMDILSAVNPDEIMITPLVLKNKQLKTLKPKIEVAPTEESPTPVDGEVSEEKAPEIIENTDGAVNVEEKVANNITINIAQTCPICNRAIREIMYALHDYEHDCLAHFDCVYKKVSESIKEKLDKNHYLVYLGSGSFGIMENNNNKLTLMEKIYPGAPVEEMLHGDEVVVDEEI